MNKNKRKENNEMIRKIRIIILFIIISIIVIMPKSYAKIEIKPSPEANANKVMVNSNISNSYLVCQQMKDKGGNLYGTSVKPHLATNKDWGAVSYLSNSMYGTNTRGQNNGIEITTNGVKYYSTNGNVSGVMNWGRNPYSSIRTQASCLNQNYSKENNNIAALVSALDSESEFVELIGTNWGNFTTDTKGMALDEIKGYSFLTSRDSFNNSGAPVSIRIGLFSFKAGSAGGDEDTRGKAVSNVTFRPVIWNQ